MKIPSVHMNGSGSERLVSQLENAGNAVQAALEALCEAAPNARDYYVQGDNAYNEARKEHDARCEKLRSVLAEVQEIHGGVYEQIDARDRQRRA